MLLLKASAVWLLLLAFLSSITTNAFFGFKKVPKLKEEPFKSEVYSQEAKPVQNPLFRRIQVEERLIKNIVSTNIKYAVADKHLESVAKSMKTVLDCRVKKLNRQENAEISTHQRRIQPKVRVNVRLSSNPIARSSKAPSAVKKSSESVKFQRIAKSMKAVVDRETETSSVKQSVIQGFEVEGDSSNKIVFLDLEALKSSGIDLDRVSISAGPHDHGRRGRPLTPIEGLKAKSSNFNSVVERARLSANKHLPRIPTAGQQARISTTEHQPIYTANKQLVFEPPAGQRCSGRNYEGRRCCTPENPCDEGEGDCDGPADGGGHDGHAGCKGELLCGSNNCKQFGAYYHEKDDCCERPQSPAPTSTNGVTSADLHYDQTLSTGPVVPVCPGTTACNCISPSSTCSTCHVDCTADCNDLTMDSNSKCFSELACDPELLLEVDNTELCSGSPPSPVLRSEHRGRLPTQPGLAVKHVSASQAAGGQHQVSLGSAAALDSTVVRPVKVGGAARKQSLFFGKLQGENDGNSTARAVTVTDPAAVTAEATG